ncbi:glutamate receptor ionotropic, kainate glr-3-like isoform X2 [Mercenaria mercenaria]|uniref:glutamate receptor ionotropic, kainate glr-3-like isoform X2 n=1 Tax=Mercenaria mercenaria TaxID=6596 RepID=UPI00234E3C6D|nr:glutamate receptor ionotropic, kainate glr-3-like isoform X2 [Mercenaria mercenaria]
MATFVKFLLFLLLTFGFLSSINAQTKPHVKVAAVQEPPYLMQESDGEFSGIVPDILNKLGYNYTIYIPPDNRYGFQYKNGTWTGMIGELVDGSADIAGLFTVTARRSEFVDTSFPVMSIGLSILMKKPGSMEQSLQEHLTKLLYPFEGSVWLMSFVALFVTSTVLYIMMHFNPYEWRRMSRDHEATLREGESFTCPNAFFFVASTLMWQGYVRAPRSIGARVLVVAWWAFTVIFIVSYTASLTNYLRLGPHPVGMEGYTKIRSFRDLANTNDVRVGFHPSGSTKRFLRESKSTVYQDLYQKGIEDPSFGSLNNTASFVNYVRSRPSGEFAVILESSASRYIVNQLPCNLYAINEGFPMHHYVFGLQKNSPLKEELNMALLRLSETGELHEIERKWFKSKVCSDAVLPSHEYGEIKILAFYRLDLATFSTALLIVIAGIIIGGVICIIEICIYRKAETIYSSAGD